MDLVAYLRVSSNGQLDGYGFDMLPLALVEGTPLAGIDKVIGGIYRPLSRSGTHR